MKIDINNKVSEEKQYKKYRQILENKLELEELTIEDLNNDNLVATNMLSDAAFDNDLSLAKALLLCKELVLPADINGDLGRILGYFCEHNNLPAIKFLLTDSRLKTKADIKNNDNIALRCAIDSGSLDAMRYLLLNDELVEHADLHNEGKEDFHNTMLRYVYRINRQSIVNKILDFLSDEYSYIRKDSEVIDKLLTITKYESDFDVARIVNNVAKNLINIVNIEQNNYNEIKNTINDTTNNIELLDQKTILYKERLSDILKQENPELYNKIMLADYLNNNLTKHNSSHKKNKL